MFATYSAGLKTGRDAWCYNFNRSELGNNVRTFLAQYGDAQRDFASYCVRESINKPGEADVTDYLASTPP